MPVPYTPGGYGIPVKTALEAMNVSVWHNGGWHKGGQASNTVKGLHCTNTSSDGNWLNVTAGPGGNSKYDVVHFNFGLHDLVDPGPGEGAEHVDLPQYGKNLQEIYTRLLTIGEKVVFTTTTPCPNVTTSMGRTNAKVVAYNTQALSSLKQTAPDLLVDDLYTSVDTYCGVDYKTCSLQKPANVHFTPEGQEFMGKEVTAVILKVLGRKHM